MIILTQGRLIILLRFFCEQAEIFPEPFLQQNIRWNKDVFLCHRYAIKQGLVENRIGGRNRLFVIKRHAAIDAVEANGNITILLS